MTIACGLPSDEKVRADFLRENPGCEVTSVVSGEGDADHVYKYIHFQSENGACEVEWGYRRAEPEWQVFHRGVPLPSKAECACS
jgi:hypothetical protein